MQDVLPIGEQIIRRAGLALVIGHQSLDHLAGMVFLALYHDGVSAVVDDLKGDPLEVGIALGSAACNGILLLHSQTATLHVIHSCDGNRMAVLPHLDGFPLPGQQHGLVGGSLSHLIGAVRQEVAAGAGVT